MRRIYERLLHASLDSLAVTAVFALIILVSNYFLFVNAKRELAPIEDQGVIISIATAAPDATLQQTQLFTRQIYEIYRSFPETDHVFQLDGLSGLNTGIASMVLKPWDERTRTAISFSL